jgi:hypothetical protein
VGDDSDLKGQKGGENSMLSLNRRPASLVFSVAALPGCRGRRPSEASFRTPSYLAQSKAHQGQEAAGAAGRFSDKNSPNGLLSSVPRPENFPGSTETNWRGSGAHRLHLLR